MKKPFINQPLIVSLGISSAFVAFLSTFGVLYFRQEAFVHGNNMKKIEAECTAFERKNLILAAKIAQLQAPYQLKEKFTQLSFQDAQEKVFQVRNWDEYKDLFVARNTLAMARVEGTRQIE